MFEDELGTKHELVLASILFVVVLTAPLPFFIKFFSVYYS